MSYLSLSSKVITAMGLFTDLNGSACHLMNANLNAILCTIPGWQHMFQPPRDSLFHSYRFPID
jgi:hypothetical protein